MKITCTQYQKTRLIKMIDENINCILDIENCEKDCRDCIEKNIEWENKYRKMEEIFQRKDEQRQKKLK